MNSWARNLEKRLKGHDSLLFVQEAREGRYDVYRKSETGSHMPHFIFSLTEDWTVNSRPTPYGIDTVLNRIKAHDLWRDDTFIERYIKQCEDMSEAKERSRKNSIESFLYDFRKQFARATESVNTGSLKQIYRKEK